MKSRWSAEYNIEQTVRKRLEWFGHVRRRPHADNEHETTWKKEKWRARWLDAVNMNIKVVGLERTMADDRRRRRRANTDHDVPVSRIESVSESTLYWPISPSHRTLVNLSFSFVSSVSKHSIECIAIES